MEQLTNRVAHLEFRVEALGDEITELKTTQKTFGESLLKIEKILGQIKWAIIGAGALFTVESLGLKEVITRLILH